METVLEKKQDKAFEFFGNLKAEAGATGPVRIKGYASTFSIDRGGDRISPKAFDTSIAEFMTNPVLLINHENNTKCVFGHVEVLRIDDKGLYIEAVLSEAPDVASDVIKVKESNLKAFSIGGRWIYNPNGPDASGIYEIVQVKLYEISVVAVPMNGEALFGVKSFSDVETSVKNGMDRNQAIKMLESINSSQVLKEDEKQKAIELLVPIINPKQVQKEEVKNMKTVEELTKELDLKTAELAKKEAEIAAAAQKVLSFEDLKKVLGEAFVEMAKEIGTGMKQMILPIANTNKYKFYMPIDGKSHEFIGEYKSKENLTLEDKQLLDCLLNRKVMTTGGSATGAEFIPAELANQLIAMFRIPETVPSLFLDIPFSGKGDTYKLPIDLSDPTWYLSAQTSSDTGARYKASTPGTGKVTFTYAKVTARIPASEEMVEDSIIPILDLFRAKLAASCIEMLSEVILDGDTTGSHQDSDVTGADDRRKSWKGLRKLALAASLKVDVGTYSITTVRAVRAMMGKFGLDKTKLAWILGPSAYYKTMNLTEFSTVDKAGVQAATIVNGVLQAIDGIPVITSGKVREDLNASGVYDGSTMTKTFITLVKKDGFLLSTKRELIMKTKEDMDDSVYVNASIRKDFQPVVVPSSTYKTVVVGYNLTSA